MTSFCGQSTALALAVVLTGAQFPQADAQTTTASPQRAVPVASQMPPRPNTLLDGTPVKLRLGRTISSADVKVGDEVDFESLEDTAVDGVVVIPKGSIATATVTDAEHKKTMGRAGKLNVNIDSVRLADGEKAALRANEGGKGGGHVGAMTGAIVATSIVFFPAAPLFLFMHGKDITIPKGTEITAYIDGDMALQMARFAPALNMGPALTPAAQPSTQSLISVNANVPNCDIEVDGAFAGNTPSQLSLPSGRHEIAVTKNGYAPWLRTVMIAGPAIQLNADLQVKASPQSSNFQTLNIPR